MKRKTHKRVVSWLWIFALWAVLFCGGCGPKYEPISLDNSSEPKKEEKKSVVLGEETKEESTAIQEEETTDRSIDTESMESVENESETSQLEELVSSEAVTESLSEDDMFYQQCGMSREEAEHGRTSFIEDVMNDSKDAVAARISYPRTVTVASGSYEVQDAVGFLAYYDEIFTEAFKMKLDSQAEQELFCSDGMISFGEGQIWFFPSDSGSTMGISSIDNQNGGTVRYGGEPGVTGG